MKYFVAILCLAQIVFAAPPAEPTIIEQAQQQLAALQTQAQAAVTDLNTRVLKETGAENNQALLNTVKTQAETYATQVKGYADQLGVQFAKQRHEVDTMFGNLAKQISDTAAGFLGNNDPTKVDGLKSTFGNVLEQTNALNAQLQQQGAAAQAAFAETLGKLYQQTLDSANTLAQQLDAKKP